MYIPLDLISFGEMHGKHFGKINVSNLDKIQ